MLKNPIQSSEIIWQPDSFRTGSNRRLTFNYSRDILQMDEREWTPATRNRYQAALSLIFRVGVDNGKITSNPASRIKRKPEDNEVIRYLTKEEEMRLEAVIKEHWPHYLEAFLISIHTGMRSSAQFNLTWRDVSLERRQIRRKKWREKDAASSA
jgi:integrase